MMLRWAVYQALFLASDLAVLAFKLDFRGVTDIGPRNHRSELNIPAINELLYQRYVVNLTIGTPPQHFALTVDTGSTDVWVAQKNSSGCAPSCPPPIFDPQASSTYKPTGNKFNASFGLTPDLQVTGPYFNDTLRIGHATIPNMTLALGNIPKEIYDAGIYGLLGLGSRLAETIYRNPTSPFAGDASGTFPTIYDQLLAHGYIKKRLFSLWLDDQAASTGSILFGGVDHDKFYGELQKVPLVLSGPKHLFTDWAVNLTNVALVDTTNESRQNLTGDVLTVILDSGSPNMYLPLEIANTVSGHLNATTYQGFPYVSCSLRQSDTEVLEFSFGNSRHGPRIKVPYSELLYPFGYPANLGNVTAEDGSKLCYLGLIGTPGPIALLGTAFIRSAYVVYDVDNLQVLMAPSRFDSSQHGHKDDGGSLELSK